MEFMILQSHWSLPHSSNCTVKVLGYFNQILVTSVAFLLCVCDTKFKECLQFEQSVVEKRSSSVKLVSHFRKSINQHFW